MPRWLFWTLLTLLSWGIWAILCREIGDSLSQAHIQVVSTLGVLPILAVMWFLPDSPPAGDRRLGTWLAFGSGIVSCVGNIPYYGLLSQGAKAATAVPVTALYPVVTILLAQAVLKERINRPQLVGIGLSLAAIYLFNVQSEKGLVSWWLAMAMVPIVLWGVTALMQKLATDHISGRASSIWFLLAFFPVAGMIVLVDPLPRGIPLSIVALSAVVGFALAFGNLTFILAFASGGKASVIAPLAGLYPVVSIPIAIVAYGERLDWREGVGIACALAAVVLLSYQSPPAPAASVLAEPQTDFKS